MVMDNKLVIQLLKNKTEEIQNLLEHFSNNPNDMSDGIELLESRMNGLLNEFEILKRNYNKQSSSIPEPQETISEPKVVIEEKQENESNSLIEEKITEPIIIKAKEKEIEKPETIIEIEKKESAIVHENLQAETVEIVGNNLSSQKISDIQSAIGINDRFLFTRELFENNIEEYNSAISFVNNSNEFQSILNWMKNEKEWDLEDPTVVQFVEITKRKF